MYLLRSTAHLKSTRATTQTAATRIFLKESLTAADLKMKKEENKIAENIFSCYKILLYININK